MGFYGDVIQFYGDFMVMLWGLRVVDVPWSRVTWIGWVSHGSNGLVCRKCMVNHHELWLTCPLLLMVLHGLVRWRHGEICEKLLGFKDDEGNIFSGSPSFMGKSMVSFPAKISQQSQSIESCKIGCRTSLMQQIMSKLGWIVVVAFEVLGGLVVDDCERCRSLKEQHALVVPLQNGRRQDNQTTAHWQPPGNTSEGFTREVMHGSRDTKIASMDVCKSAPPVFTSSLSRALSTKRLLAHHQFAVALLLHWALSQGELPGIWNQLLSMATGIQVRI